MKYKVGDLVLLSKGCSYMGKVTGINCVNSKDYAVDVYGLTTFAVFEHDLTSFPKSWGGLG